jgi:hypothetical protein
MPMNSRTTDFAAAVGEPNDGVLQVKPILNGQVVVHAVVLV